MSRTESERIINLYFSPEAKRIVTASYQLAKRSNHPYVGVEHFVFAMGVVARNPTQQAVGEKITPMRRPSKPEFTPDAKRVIEEAAAIAIHAGVPEIDTLHLVAALVVSNHILRLGIVEQEEYSEFLRDPLMQMVLNQYNPLTEDIPLIYADALIAQALT